MNELVAARAHVIVRREFSVWHLIGAFTLLRLMLAAVLPVFPQEAYYWTWSRDLAWSYFDHPPLAAYSIRLTTAVFGSTAFGIKLAAVLWSLAWNLLWARLVLDMFGDRRLAFWSVLALNLMVGYEAYGVMTTPDAPLLAASVGTVWAIWRLCDSGDSRWWYVAGCFLGLSWLGKYSGILLVPAVGLFLLASARQRRWLATPHPYLACALAVAVFSPVLAWNAAHDWASFAFQGSGRVGGMGQWKPHHFLALVVSQLVIATPYLLFVALGAFVRALRERTRTLADDRVLLLFMAGAVPLVLFTAVSFRSQVKMNWLVIAYWPLVILGVRRILDGKRGIGGLKAGLASSAALVFAAVAVFALPNMPVGDANTWSGWKEAATRVSQLEARLHAAGERTVIFAPNYKISALLQYHLEGQPRTYAQDIYGEPALQFDFLPPPRDLAGATGILVVDDHADAGFDPNVVALYFASIERVDSVEVSGLGRHTRRIDIYKASRYAGYPGSKSR